MVRYGLTWWMWPAQRRGRWGGGRQGGVYKKRKQENTKKHETKQEERKETTTYSRTKTKMVMTYRNTTSKRRGE